MQRILRTVLLAIVLASSLACAAASRGSSAMRLHGARDTLRFNQWGRIACHNCYEPGRPITTFDSIMKLTNAVELDIAPGTLPGRWVVTHGKNPPNDNICGDRPTIAGFAECLAVLRSYVRDDTEVLTVFVDLKVDPSPGWGAPELDSVARSVFGDRIFTPAELGWERGRAAPAWPRLERLHGRVLLVLTGGASRVDAYRTAAGDGAAFFVAHVARVPGDVNTAMGARVAFLNLPIHGLSQQWVNRKKTVLAASERGAVSRVWYLGKFPFGENLADTRVQQFGSCFAHRGQLNYVAVYRKYSLLPAHKCKGL